VVRYSQTCDALAVPYSLVEEQPVTQLYTLLNGTCYPDTIFPDTAWTLQAEPLARFASGTLSVIGDAGEAQALRATADDGAYVNLTIEAQRQPCGKAQFAQEERCVQTPLAGVTGNTYASDKCNGPLLALSTLTVTDLCAGRKATRAVVSERQACATQNSLRALLDAVPSPFTADAAGHCDSLDASFLNEVAYRVGDSLSSSDAPLLSSLFVGSGVLELSATANRSGVPLTQTLDEWRLLDGETCSSVLDTSGIRRCMPGLEALPDTTLYADASCTQHVDATSACAPSPTYLFDEEEASTGVLTITAAHAAEPHTGTVYEKQADECRPFEAPSGFRYFQRGAAVDLDTFPIITETTDP